MVETFTFKKTDILSHSQDATVPFLRSADWCRIFLSNRASFYRNRVTQRCCTGTPKWMVAWEAWKGHKTSPEWP